MTFYGSSFISDHTGQLVAKASRDREEVLLATFDLDAIAALRASWATPMRAGLQRLVWHRIASMYCGGTSPSERSNAKPPNRCLLWTNLRRKAWGAICNNARSPSAARLTSR